MKEEIIVSGRMNPKIDPILNIWHWEIPLYLFLGGLAAGILFFASLYFILGKEKKEFIESGIAWHTAYTFFKLGIGNCEKNLFKNRFNSSGDLLIKEGRSSSALLEFLEFI